MTARFLLGVFDSVYLVAMAAWVGSLMFMTLGVTPILLRVLNAEDSGKLVRALFPRLYMWGAIAGAIALPAFVAIPLSYPEYRGPTIAVQSMVLLSGILSMLYAANSLTPALNAARVAGPAGTDRYHRLRHRSVVLNLAVLLAGLCLLVVHANRPVPRTTGLRQRTPAEIAEIDAELGPLITRLEARYGFRPGSGKPDEPAIPPGHTVDADTIRELQSYYEQKQKRELERRGVHAVAPKQESQP